MKHLFLDLEDTVITPVLQGWHNTELINVDKVKRCIETEKPDLVHIFSFAIWDQQQKFLFQQHVQTWLERELGVKLSLIPTMDDDILPRCGSQLRLGIISFEDACAFLSKSGAFRLFGKSLFKDAECILLDDMVDDEVIRFPGLNLTLDIRNVDKMA